MRRIAFLIAVVLSIQMNGLAQSYGLTFGSHETVLEKRTSLDISPDDSICFSKNFELGFDINYLPNHRTYFGYILRIISNGDQNIDLIYHQKSHTFRVINGETFSNISFIVDSPQLYKDWNRIVLKFNLENQTLLFEVNGTKAGECNIPLNFRCFKFLWGANDFEKYKTRDIPPMQIKDIKIYENSKLRYFWPLNESSGNIGYDVVNKQAAIVKNPNWLKPKYQKWELLNSFTLNGYGAVAYDAKTDKVYVVGSDSLVAFNINSEKGQLEWIPNRHMNLRVGHQSIFDTSSNKLYDFFIDQKKVIAYDFMNHQWNSDFETGKITEFWHANKFISELDSSLYILGGYGQLRYKNWVQRYSFATKTWDSLTTSGDYSPPRYLAALGKDPTSKYVYIIGGYGSQTGDQMLDPRNFYDMYRFNIKDRSFKRMYALKPTENQFTFVNSLVIDPKTNNYYGLIFPNDSSNSNLQLIKGSLSDSSYVVLGNKIPFTFHDIESFADLYYSPISNKLITVVLNYSKSDDPDKNTLVKIYSLNFVPVPEDNIINEKPFGSHRIIFAVGLLLMATLVVAIVFYIRRKKSLNVLAKIPIPIRESDIKSVNRTNYFQTSDENQIHSAIYLFGQFQVIDKEGNDITGLFTPLLKELFLIVCINSIRQGRGISSEMLNERLWHDKSEKDAKNNRSVNIAKLKIILEKIGNCAISKESGSWQFQKPDENIYIDFQKFNSIIQHNNHHSEKYDIRSMVDIIKRGSFLYMSEYDWLDSIKSEISNTVIDLCLSYIRKNGVTHEPEFIIEITNCIFHFDHLNEDALIYQCKCLIVLKRFTLASNIFLKFAKEYKDIYGMEFTKSFHETIA
jgi:two-component SAPR family response regulator